MLKQRIITAVLLVPPLIAALFLLPPVGVAVLFGVFIALGAWEWGGLCKLGSGPRVGFVAFILVAGTVLIVFSRESSGLAQALLAVATAWWLFVVFQLGRGAGSVFHFPRGRLIAGAATLIPAWVAVSLLHAGDGRRPLVLLFVLALVAVADSAAYAAGHAFGRTKLAPSVSPGKTVEGVVGGTAAVVLLSYFCGTIVWRHQGLLLAVWVALGTIAGLVSVIGDLSESKLKRIAGVKDSGRLLPGHGGVLDRIDALTAAAPTFALGWLIFIESRS